MSAAEHLQPSQFGYHISPARNRESIAEQGLLPGDGKHVWFYPASHEDVARQLHTASGTDMEGRKPDLYRVNLTGMRTALDPHKIARGAGGRVVKRAITPDRVERIA